MELTKAQSERIVNTLIELLADQMGLEATVTKVSGGENKIIWRTQDE